MYLNHFGLSQPPFKITPNTGFFFIGGNRGAILDALLYAITHGEGIVKVTGEIGSGKTMLCRMLESLLPKNVEAIYLVNPSLNRDDVFHVIAGELGLATQGKRTSETLHLIQESLIEKHSTGKQVVLLVEEAQAMPLDTLEEIRLLSNLETAHHKLLQIVLFGQPELNQNLALPNMRQLKERITHSFTVPPLSKSDIPEYLMFRMRAAGYHGPDIFSKGAVKLVTAASKGITRRINVLADKALLAAFSEGTHDILPQHVKAAIADSEFAGQPGDLRLRQLCLTTGLLVLGIILGLGWQHFGNFAFRTEVAASPEASTEHLLQQRLDATQSWLGHEDGSHFTVQLLLPQDTDAEPQFEILLNKLEKEVGLSQIYIYPTRTKADKQFGVTFGSFSSRQQALASIAKLPAGYVSNRPVLRTVKGIRDEIAKQQPR